jgi:hypothetical protein
MHGAPLFVRTFLIFIGLESPWGLIVALFGQTA